MEPEENKFKNNGLLINKAFFGKNTVLKIQYHKEKKQAYIHAGKKTLDAKWTWNKVKFSDSELGMILNVLSGKTEKISFFHKFNGNKKQIWINKDNGILFFKIDDISKSLTLGEQEVMKILLQKIILMMNLESKSDW